MSAKVSEPVPSANLPRGLAPLGYRDFTLYLAGNTVTNAGRWIELTGYLWLVYELTDSPFLVGLLGAARALPALLLSPFAGVVADRLDQRLLLMATQLAGLLCTLGLVGLLVSDAIELWQIYVLLMVQTTINSFDAAGRQALYPRLVPRELLPKAVTLNITGARVSKLLGPASAGFLIAGLGVAAPFVVNALSFLVMVAALLHIPSLGSTAAEHRTSFGKELLEGLQHILSAPVLSGILILEVVFGLFEMNPTMIAIIGREILEVGPRALGLLLSAPALGAFLGLAWLLYAQRMGRQGRLSLMCMFIYACTMAFLSISPGYAVAFAALSVIGVLEVVVTAMRSTIMQLAAPAHLRGRLMANMGTVTRGTGPLAETQSGFLASAIGPGGALLAAAGAVGATTVLMAVLNRELWRYSLEESMTSPRPSLPRASDQGSRPGSKLRRARHVFSSSMPRSKLR